MIAYINGLLIDKEERSVVVLAQSIGYAISVPTELLSSLKIDQKVQLFIHTVVREDDIALYGFSNKEEKAFFVQLLGVSGIGPKMGMEILSSPLHLTKQAILNGDVSMLTKIKGLGKKTAERLILEMKGKIDLLVTSSGSNEVSTYDNDALEALVTLGYEKVHVLKALSKMPKEIEGTESIIKYFLQNA